MQKAERIVSVDFLRGLTVAVMILVNNPGSWEHIYAPLQHAHWNGCTPTDLVFPFFLFIVGISISCSLWTARQQPEKHKALIWKIIKRSLILFALGLFLQGFPYFDFATIRIPGVLQRIALVFLVSALLFLKTPWRVQVILGAGMLILYWLLMTLVPVPPLGVPGLSVEHNLAAYVDFKLLPGHLWKPTWDPEGVLSTLPAIVSGLMGVWAGYWMQTEKNPQHKISRLALAGMVLLSLGLLWDMVFPINKSLWTSSYVMFTSGIGLLALSFCYWLVDVKQWRKGLMPFFAFGSNAITAYMLAELLSRSLSTWPIGGYALVYDTFAQLTQLGIAPKLASLFIALAFVGVIFTPIYILYRRKIFIKV